METKAFNLDENNARNGRKFLMNISHFRTGSWEPESRKRTAQILEDQNRHGWNDITVREQRLEIISVNADDKKTVISVLGKEPRDMEDRDNM